MLHDPANAGSGILRCLAYFTSAAALHTWEVPLMPMGTHGEQYLHHTARRAG
jgi:hypothetical protein